MNNWNIPHKEIIKSFISYDKKKNLLLKELKLETTDFSPLDYSYCEAIFLLFNLPEENQLKNYRSVIKNYDVLYDDYTAMVYGLSDIDTTMDKWDHYLKPIYHQKPLKKQHNKVLKIQTELESFRKSACKILDTQEFGLNDYRIDQLLDNYIKS